MYFSLHPNFNTFVVCTYYYVVIFMVSLIIHVYDCLCIKFQCLTVKMLAYTLNLYLSLFCTKLPVEFMNNLNLCLRA